MSAPARLPVLWRAFGRERRYRQGKDLSDSGLPVIVKKFLEKRVFDLPQGTSLKLDSVDEKTDRIVKNNIFSDDVMPVVKQELIKFINSLRKNEKPTSDKFEIK